MTKKKNYYEVLNVDPLSDSKVITTKYSKLEETLKGDSLVEAKEAFMVLTNKAKREKYNKENGFGEDYVKDRDMPEMHQGMQAVLDRRAGVVREPKLQHNASAIGLAINKPRSDSGGSLDSQKSGVTDSEDRSNASSPLSVNSGGNSPQSESKKPAVVTGIFNAEKERRGRATNAKKQGVGKSVVKKAVATKVPAVVETPAEAVPTKVPTKVPTVVEAVKTYEYDADGTRIKFDKVNSLNQTVDEDIKNTIISMRSMFTRAKAYFNHDGFLTEKETRAVKALDSAEDGKKDVVAIDKALKAAVIPKKGWGRG